MKMKNNKKGSLAFVFLYSISFLIGLGLLYIIFNQTIVVHLNPVLDSQIADDSPEREHILALNVEFLSYWRIVPIFLLFTVLLYMFVNGISQGRQK
jgi:hypothetical protein